MTKNFLVALYLLSAFVFFKETASKTSPDDGLTENSLSSVEPYFFHDEESPSDGSETDEGSDNFVPSDDTGTMDEGFEPAVGFFIRVRREERCCARIRYYWYAIAATPTLVALSMCLYFVIFGK